MRVRRLIAALVGVVALPLTLSACGLLGGDGKNQAPVVIPTLEAGGAGATDGTVSPSAHSRPAAPVSSAPAAPPPSTVLSTVTRTGIVVQQQTRTAIRTAVETRVLPQVTVTRTLPPTTVTETHTETTTRIVTSVSVSVSCKALPPSTCP